MELLNKQQQQQMSFVESILIPKSSFLDIKEKLNNKNKKKQ